MMLSQERVSSYKTPHQQSINLIEKHVRKHFVDAGDLRKMLFDVHILVRPIVGSSASSVESFN